MQLFDQSRKSNISNNHKSFRENNFTESLFNMIEVPIIDNDNA